MKRWYLCVGCREHVVAAPETLCSICKGRQAIKTFVKKEAQRRRKIEQHGKRF